MRQNLCKWSVAMGLLLSSTGYSQRTHLPSYDGLYASKQICMGMSKKVKSLISLVQREESESPRGPWAVDEHDEVLENDTAAYYALMGMGKGTFALGQALDEAMANYGTPAFYHSYAKVCGATHVLIGANKGAKIAAKLPVTNLITPQEFDQFDVELQQVQAQTNCY